MNKILRKARSKKLTIKRRILGYVINEY